MSAWQVRPLVPEDAAQARLLVQNSLDGTRHASRVLEQLEVAIAGGNTECAAAVLCSRDRPAPSGVALFGSVAGAVGVIKLHALVGMDADDMILLVNGLMLEPHVRESRMVVCELADDSACSAAAAALLACGFLREGRVEDFFADGVTLDLLVRRR